MEKSLDTLLRGLIDYAGLFPPASLDMPAAVRNYAVYRQSAEAAWLGRFVVPAARLEEMARAVETMIAEETMGAAANRGAGSDNGPDAGESADSDPVPGPWRLSALIGPDPSADFRTIRDFNRLHGGAGARADMGEAVGAGGASGAVAASGTVAADAASTRRQPLLVDVLEMKVGTPGDVEAAMAGKPEGLTAYFEIPIQQDPSPLLLAIGGAGGRAKVRTGGVTGDLFPAPELLARFLLACARAGVPFKATAGLHHPVRSVRPLTYAPGSPTALMHGFLNVFLAAAFAAEGMAEGTLAALLTEESPSAFRFEAGAVSWRGHSLPEARLAKARRDFAIAFGSCSFEEPREDLSEAGLL